MDLLPQACQKARALPLDFRGGTGMVESHDLRQRRLELPARPGVLVVQRSMRVYPGTGEQSTE